MENTKPENEEGFLKRLTKPLKKTFKENIVIFIFTSGVICLILSAVPIIDLTINERTFITGKNIQSLFLTVGTILISSGAFSAITKSRLFFEIFRTSLQEIVYQEKFLKNQKNIDQIWEKITKSLCDQNFDGLSDKIFANIKKNYLPINNDFYYEDYNVTIIINEDPLNPDYLIIEEETACTIKTKNKKDEYAFSSIIIHEDLPDSIPRSSHEIKQVIINGIEKQHADFTQRENSNSRIKSRGIFPLSGSSTYKILRKEKKIYNYKINPNRIQTATKLYKDMNISIHFPNTFNVDFVELGTTEKWEQSETRELNGTKWFSVQANNLIFVNQGYLLNFRKI